MTIRDRASAAWTWCGKGLSRARRLGRSHLAEAKRTWRLTRGRALVRLRPKLASARRFVREYSVGILLLGASAVVFFTPIEVPRLGAFEDPDRLAGLMGVIAGTLAAVMAIVVAVTFVVFQAMRETYAGFASREILATPVLRHLVTAYVFAVALALLLQGSIGSHVPTATVRLGYLELLLAGGCLIALYPATRHMLSGARVGRNRIAEIAASTGERDLHRLGRANRLPLQVYLSELEEHPLFVLAEIGVRSIQASDRLAPKYVILEITGQLSQQVENWGNCDGRGLRSLVNAFLVTLRPIGRTAVQHRDEGTVVTLCQAAAHVHDVAAEHGVPWHSLIEFNEWLSDLGADVARSGMEQGTRATVWMAGDALKAHLEHNAPAEEDIWTLHPFEEGTEQVDHEKASQWGHLSSTYFRMLSGIHTATMRADHPDGASQVIFALGQLAGDFSRADYLGPRQKSSLIGTASYYMHSMTVAAARKWGAQLDSLWSTSPFQLGRDIEAAEPWAKLQLQYYCKTFRKLADLGTLRTPELNDLGAIGRGLVRHVEGDLQAAALVLIADTLYAVASAFASRPHMGDAGLVGEAERQLHSLERWFESVEVEHPSIQQHIEKLLRGVRTMLEDSPSSGSRLNWPSLEALEVEDNGGTAEAS